MRTMRNAGDIESLAKVEKRTWVTPCGGAAALLLVCLLFGASPAQACCTNTTCSFCVSSTSGCLAGCFGGDCPNAPVCNSFGCNCNEQCGCSTVSGGACVPASCCDNTAASRLEAQKRFDEIDSDDNQKISFAESRAWLTKNWGKSASGRFDAKALAESASAAALASDENVFRAYFDKVDTDHSGYVSPGELDKSLASPAAASKK